MFHPLYPAHAGPHASRLRRAYRRPACVLAAIWLAGCSSAPQTLEGPAGDVRELTGAHTRVVWVQGDGTDPFAERDNLVVMGFDTDDGRGERVILGERRNYAKPLLTSRGDRIVVSSRSAPDRPEILLVNWDGSGLRRLAAGFALAVWRDPADGREWVYGGRDNKAFEAGSVVRFPIDDPGAEQVVWNKTSVALDTFQVSADGRLAGGLFPWPDAGVAELPNAGWRKLGDGCWTALADVGDRLFWYFDGSHRNVTVVDLGANRRWTVNINGAPGFRGAEVYHPRWTNHPRFLALSGPYNQGGVNQVRSGGAQAEIHLGRFSADFSEVEAWARVTHNAGGDAYPDVWIDRDQSPYPVRPDAPLGRAAEAAGEETAGRGAGAGNAAGRLVVKARLVRAGPIPTPRSIEPYRQALAVNLYEILDADEGSGAAQVLVAQWAIRDGRVIAGAQKAVGTVYALTLEPYDAHPELEGERLIIESDAPDLPLFYDIGD